MLWLMSNAGSSELAEPQPAGSSAGGGKGLAALPARLLLKSCLWGVSPTRAGSEQGFHSRGEASGHSQLQSCSRWGSPPHLFPPR